MADISFDKNLFTAKVAAKSLKVGDILNHDVYLTNGALLATAGTELTESKIQKLVQLGDRIVTLDLTKVYQKGVSVSKALFKDAAEEKPIKQIAVEVLLEPFIEEVKREKNIAKLLGRLQCKDEYTFQHTVKIGILSMVLGGWMGLSESELYRLAMAGTLHDIGKSKIDLNILNKPGPLTNTEFAVMKMHTVYGYDIVNNSDDYDESIKLAVLQHHERTDGNGYPYGLTKDQIHLFARIVAVVDIYHAMTSTRVYSKKRNPFLVLEHLQNNLTSLDTEVVLTFVNNMLSALQGCKILLSNDLVGDIIFVDKNCLSKPLVKIKDTRCVINLMHEKNVEIVDVVHED